VLELQLIHGNGYNEIHPCPGTGYRILGHILADTTVAPRQTGREDKTSDRQEKPEEQTYKLIGGTKFQYWLTSEPHGSMEGLNVLLEILPDFPIHIVTRPVHSIRAAQTGVFDPDIRVANRPFIRLYKPVRGSGF
jgi:hypothetical protein